MDNQIRPSALSHINWLYARLVRRGQQTAVVITSAWSAKLTGNDPYVYLKDAQTPLPTQANNASTELSPHYRICLSLIESDGRTRTMVY
ncbi:hypothetical protein GCM10009113_04070 [Marinobacter szutsaonensis]